MTPKISPITIDKLKKDTKILITDGFFLSKFPILTFSRSLIFCQPQFHLHALCVIRCRQKQGVDGPYKKNRIHQFGVITGVVGLTYFTSIWVVCRIASLPSRT